MSLSPDLDALVRGQHGDPFRLLGPHVDGAGGRRDDSGAQAGRARRRPCGSGTPRQTTVAMTRRHADGLFEADVPGVTTLEHGIDYRLLVDFEGGDDGRARRPLPIRPHHHRLRPAPVRRRAVAAGAGSSRRAPHRPWRHRRRALRRLGAQRAARLGRGRLQRMGWPRPRDAAPAAVRRVGVVRARPRRRRDATSSRSARRPVTCCTRSIRTAATSKCRRARPPSCAAPTATRGATTSGWPTGCRPDRG